MVQARKLTKTTILAFSLSAIFVSAGFIWAYVSLRNISQPLVLHFNELVGITQNGTMFNLIAVFVLSLIGFGVNFVLAMQIERFDRYVARFIAFATLLYAILLFIGFRVIISVN